MKKLFLILLLLVPGRLLATTRYVATTGSDGAAGTIGAPFRTLAHAWAVSTAGDIIYMRGNSGGTYAEHIGATTTLPSGIAGNPITISGYPSEVVTLTGTMTDAIFDPAHGEDYINLTDLILDGTNTVQFPIGGNGGPDYWTLTRVEVKNATGTGIIPHGNHWTFIDCNIHHNGHVTTAGVPQDHGMYLSGSFNTIDGGQYHDNWGSGLQIYESGASANNGNVVRNARIYANGTGGSAGGVIMGSGTDGLMYNNLIYNNNGDGLQIDHATDRVAAYNNTIYGNSGQGIFLGATTLNSKVKNNILWSNGTNAVIDTGSDGSNAAGISNNLTTNPDLTNPAGFVFTLQGTSAAIGTGLDLSAVMPATDFMGTARTAPWDRGAYKYTSASCTPHHLTFTSQPSSNILGGNLGPTYVVIKDVGGVTCTAATNTITLSKNGSATWGTLASGSSLAKAASAGVAFWTDLSVTTTTGAGSIDAAASGLTGATSASITIASYFGHTEHDATSLVAYGAGAFDLTGQAVDPTPRAHWAYYKTYNCTEGCWQSFFDVNSPSDTMLGAFTLYDNPPATVTPITLTAGTYHVFIYGLELRTFATGSWITLSCGSATSTQIVADDDVPDYTGYWSEAGTLTVVTPCTAWTISMHRPSGADQAFYLRGIYLTTDLERVVTEDLVPGLSVNLTYPTIMDDSAPIKGNLACNASFETGVDACFGLYGTKTTVLADMWQSSCDGGAHTGSACLKLPLDAASNLPNTGTTTQWISRLYHLKPNKKYSISAWVKAASGTPTVLLEAFNAFVPPAGFTPQPTIQGLKITSTSWQRVTITNQYLLGYPTADYNFTLSVNSASSSNFIYIDDFQVEEGNLTTYAAPSTLDCTLSTANAGHIYFTTDTLTATQRCYNSSGALATGTLYYEIYDYLDNLIVGPSTASLSIAATTTTSGTLSTATGGKLGSFRFVYRTDNGPDKEFHYSIIFPTTTSADATSNMGTHPNYIASSLDTLQRLGIKWSRDLSPAGLCRWELTEPADGTFVWRDAELAVLTSHNIEPLCTLTANAPGAIMSWAYSGGNPILAKYSAFVTAVVNHYKSLGTHYYECWNEPLSVMSANWYAQILKTCVDAIETEDVTAKIVGMGGLNADDIAGVITQLNALYMPSWDYRTHLHALSSHDYGEGADPATLTPFVAAGRRIWNTEAGTWDQGAYHGIYSNFLAWGTAISKHSRASRYYEASIKSPALLSTNYAATIAAGLEKYFEYDARVAAAPNYFQHHPTLLEYDGSVRHKAITYACAGHFIDHATGHGNASTDGNSQFYPFETAGDPVAFLYSTDNIPRQVVIGNSITHGQLTVYDQMCNVITITGTTVPYGRQPVYVVMTGGAWTVLGIGLGSLGVVSVRADTTAPNVTIVDGPRGLLPYVTALNPIRMRFLPLDETSYPTIGEFNPLSDGRTVGMTSNAPDPNAMLCSYRLDSLTSFSAYSADTYVDYTSVPGGTYNFEVKCKDAAGNVSATASRQITVAADAKKLTMRHARKL